MSMRHLLMLLTAPITLLASAIINYINAFNYIPHSYSILLGTDYKTALRLSVCQCIHLWAVSRSHFLIDFHQTGTDIWTPKSKNEFVGVNIAPPLPPFYLKIPILGQEVLKIHANINNNPISALNVHKSPKFLHVIGNRGRGTQLWCQIPDPKWK